MTGVMLASHVPYFPYDLHRKAELSTQNRMSRSKNTVE